MLQASDNQAKTPWPLKRHPFVDRVNVVTTFIIKGNLSLPHVHDQPMPRSSQVSLSGWIPGIPLLHANDRTSYLINDRQYLYRFDLVHDGGSLCDRLALTYQMQAHQGWRHHRKLASF